MSNQERIHPRYTDRYTPVSDAEKSRGATDTLKSLARKVLNSGVSGVSHPVFDTPIHPTADSDTPPIQQPTAAELSDSLKRLEAADIRVAVFITETDAGMIITGEQLVQGESESRQAWSKGALVFDAQEMSAYIQLSPAERRLFLGLKRAGG